MFFIGNAASELVPEHKGLWYRAVTDHLDFLASAASPADDGARLGPMMQNVDQGEGHLASYKLMGYNLQYIYNLCRRIDICSEPNIDSLLSCSGL